MVEFVSADWVESQLGEPDFLLLDPRGPMRYMQGHLRGAVNLPAVRMFGREGKLLSVYELAEYFGSVGVGNDTPVTMYDGGDGRNAAMATWALQYLGHTDIRIMDTFFETWAAQGREKLYRPVRPTANTLEPRFNPRVRATLEDVSRVLEGQGEIGNVRLLDLRSQDEFNGLPEIDDRPGHIPGAVNLVWQELVDGNDGYLESADVLSEKLSARQINPGDAVIAYCRSGIRASVGYLALKYLGYEVRLYDGSYLEWMNQGMPVEGGPGQE